MRPPLPSPAVSPRSTRSADAPSPRAGDAQAELNKQQKKSPQDAEELKRAEGNVAWYRNQLLPAQHDAYWTSHQHDPTWLEYNELRAEMDEIVRRCCSAPPSPSSPARARTSLTRTLSTQSKLVGKPRRAAVRPLSTEHRSLAEQLRRPQRANQLYRRMQHSLGKSVFVPEAMRTYRRLGGC